MNCKICGTNRAMAVEDHIGGSGRDKYLWTSCVNGHDLDITWGDSSKALWIEIR